MMEYAVPFIVVFFLGGLVWMFLGIFVDEFIQKRRAKGVPWHKANKRWNKQLEKIKKGKMKW